MYAPKQFQESREDVLLGAIGAIQLAVLMTPAEGEIHVTHLPMIASRAPDGALLLQGHVARGNGHRLAATGQPTVAVFQGPHAYISPSWYPSKNEHGKVVPTWNYIAVHAHGTLDAVTDRDWLLRHVAALTDRNEAGRAVPWSVGDAPEDYIDGMLNGIIGLSLTVSRLEGAWKMAQHRSPADRRGLIEGLAHSDDTAAHAVASVMEALEKPRG
jgi:transcriptional regulator